MPYISCVACYSFPCNTFLLYETQKFMSMLTRAYHFYLHQMNQVCAFPSCFCMFHFIMLIAGWTVEGSNPVGGQDFAHMSRPVLYTGSFLGVKQSGVWL